MATYNQNGGQSGGQNGGQSVGRNGLPPDENRTTWRPQDPSPSQGYRGRGNDDEQDYRSWRDRNYREDDRPAIERDPRRWEGRGGVEHLGYEDRDPGWRSTERYGQGQSGYSAGRYGDDRSQHLQGRSEMVPSPGSFEDRGPDLGLDDRFTGRGRPGYWQDRGSYGPERHGAQGGYGGGRGFEAERLGPPRSGGSGNPGHGGYAQGRGQHDPGQMGRSTHDGYPMGRSSYDDSQRSPDVHIHRGTGPHRGKGPVGYKRSDERLRELICEALTDDDQIDASQIEVTVKHGDVTLAGTVEDRRAKREAEECTCSVAGVRDVQNLLRVRDDRQQMRSDSSAGP